MSDSGDKLNFVAACNFDRDARKSGHIENLARSRILYLTCFHWVASYERGGIDFGIMRFAYFFSGEPRSSLHLYRQA